MIEGTFAGSGWICRIQPIAALVIAAYLPLKETTRALMLCLLCLVLALMDSLTSHAIDDGAASSRFMRSTRSPRDCGAVRFSDSAYA